LEREIEQKNSEIALYKLNGSTAAINNDSITVCIDNACTIESLRTHISEVEQRLAISEQRLVVADYLNIQQSESIASNEAIIADLQQLNNKQSESIASSEFIIAELQRLINTLSEVRRPLPCTYCAQHRPPVDNTLAGFFANMR
jgi:hypothetical protein